MLPLSVDGESGQRDYYIRGWALPYDDPEELEESTLVWLLSFCQDCGRKTRERSIPGKSCK
jgi:hypothetical protein